MNVGTAAAVFPIIFLGELPDKTMFASLVLSSRGGPLGVWIGAGSRNHLAALPPAELIRLTKAEQIDAVEQ